MKIGLIGIIVIIMLWASPYYVRAQDTETPNQNNAPPPKPGRKVPPVEFTHSNSEDVLEQLQGGNKDVFVVVFFVNDATKTNYLTKIKNEVIDKGHALVRTTAVDLKKVKEYQKLFKTLGIDGEPKRGHTEPIVLVMSQGEGVLVRGPKIVDTIKKRINRVEAKTLYGQSGNTSETDSYPFLG